jgi:predicted protein tyrosine phosphatase
LSRTSKPPIQTKPKREKHWKLMYIRSTKLARAKQLGIDYPNPDAARPGEFEDDEPLNLLFVCSRNQWRSPTAEEVWRNHPDLRVRSAGTSPNARRRVTEADLRWAHSIFVMETKHKARLQAEFARLVANKPIHVLDIPDDYQKMDPELVELLKTSVAAILGLP